MKNAPIRILFCALAALLLFTACGKTPSPDDDPGYIINQSNTDTPKSEITSFYEGNAGTLQALADQLVKDRRYTAYTYSYRMTDYENGTLEFYVLKQSKHGSIWEDCSEELANRLVAVKFVGTVTYDTTIHKEVVLFSPRMNTSGKLLSLVYCGNADAKEAVENGKYHKNCSVTLSKVADGWYCVEAVQNPDKE